MPHTCVASGRTLVVETQQGTIRGEISVYSGQNVYAYLGIPYAEPPLGDLRFKKPQEGKHWNGTLDASHFPPACPQYSPFPFTWYDLFSEQSEDCLYLNIWVPDRKESNDNEPKTVLFWIHGGGYSFGSSSYGLYHGKALAGFGNVIVVTINYRIGPFGFLYSGTEDAPGNVGLYDSLLALQWVNNNIEAFGGDRDSITIFGQSAGSFNCAFFSISPLAKGLFKRMIMESGSPLFLQDGKLQNIKLGQELAEHFGCADAIQSLVTMPEKVVECLRGVPAIDLAHAVGAMNPNSGFIFQVVFGDPIVGDNPTQNVVEKFSRSDLLIGNVLQETISEMTNSHPHVFGFFGEKNTYINKSYAEEILQTGAFKSLTEKELPVKYYIGDVDEDDLEEIRRRTGRAFGDAIAVCPSIYFAEKFSQKNPVYYYMFVKRPSVTPWAPWMGVVHMNEVQFVFGHPTLNPEKYEASEITLSQSVMKIWTDFAKKGKPHRNWSQYTEDDQVMVILGEHENEINMTSIKENCRFLRQFYAFD